MQAQNAHKILLNNLFNAHKKKNIRHNRNLKLKARRPKPALKKKEPEVAAATARKPT